MKFFHPSVRLNQPKATRGLYPFDEPIKSLFFRSFVVSVSFESFHFKVIRKSLYLLMRNGRNVMSFTDKLETYCISSNNSRGRLSLFLHKKEAMIISNITHWKSNKLNMGFRVWIVIDLFCWISLHFNLTGYKGREDCERGRGGGGRLFDGGDWSRDGYTIFSKSFSP